ncbi:MAG: hypothetical protein AAFY20_03475 [Cyanobacteria bacterium J06639_14]
MIKFIQKSVQDISSGRNLEHYITLVFITVILALDIFNLASSEVLTEITLAVLALVVFTSLSTRESLDRLSTKLIKPPNADDFFWQDKHSIAAELTRAKYIGFVGACLSRTIRDYAPILEERLKAGAIVRIILMDPSSTAPEQAVLRSKSISNKQFFVDTLNLTLERISILADATAQVELGLLPYKPAFGMLVMDPDMPHGKIIVEIYPHHSDEFAPTFELQSNRESRWYRHFRNQFDNLWHGCGQRQFMGLEIRHLIAKVRDISP